MVNVWGGECLGGERLTIFLAGQAAKRFLVEFVYFELGFWFLESASRLGLKGSWKLQMPRE